MKTVITHFYNEEYLLPWWLEHHKKYFDFGVMIDYASTDDSVAIIKETCPHWQVLPSGNAEFDASLCDHEIMFVERQITGWRIALTTTEFLVGNLDKLMTDTPERAQWKIPGIRFTEWDPSGYLDPSKVLWEQLHTGISYRSDPIAHQCRSLHNFNDLEYSPGRHFMPFNTEDALVFHYAHCIVGEPMLKRRLQIQHRISAYDKAHGLGQHHYFGHGPTGIGMDVDSLHNMQVNWLSKNSEDCQNLIDMVTKT